MSEKELKVYRLCCADCKRDLGTVAYYEHKGDNFLDRRMQAQVCMSCAQRREERRISKLIEELRESVKG